MSIEIEYNGCYPNLCSGDLVVIIDDVRWVFPRYCLISGGSTSFDKDWNGDVTDGPWSIDDWPDGFPEKEKCNTLSVVNSKIPWGCCGGCL